MKLPRMLQQGWLAATLTVLLALVPLGLAYEAFERESVQKQEQLFEATSRVVQEHLTLLSVRHLSFVNTLRFQVRNRWNTSTPLESILPQGALSTVPFVQGVGMAEMEGGRAVIRSTAGKIPRLPVGDNLFEDAAIRNLITDEQGRVIHGTSLRSLSTAEEILVVLAPMPPQGARAGGVIVAWIDLRGMCESAARIATQPGALLVTPATGGTSADPRYKEVTFREGGANWSAVIQKGPLFSQHYSLAKPWWVFVSGVCSALLLGVLVLLGTRAIQMRAELRSERLAGLQRTRFVNHVSHEFRTPLSVILSSADLLESHGGSLPPARATEAVQEIQSATRLLSEMVDEILLLQRLDSWKANVQEADIVECCEVALNMVRKVFPQGGPLEFINRAGPVNAQIDTALLRTALVNLLSNAVKYSPANTPVELELVQVPGSLVLKVRDQGLGIPENALSRLGEAFFRAGNVGEIPGTGLGLSIVRQSAQVMGGSFEIENRNEGGTLATMRIPLHS